MVKEFENGQTALHMKETGKETFAMDMENSYIQMDQSMRASSLLIFHREKERRFCQLVSDTQEFLIEEVQQELERSLLKQVLSLNDNNKAFSSYAIKQAQETSGKFCLYRGSIKD